MSPPAVFSDYYTKDFTHREREGGETHRHTHTILGISHTNSYSNVEHVFFLNFLPKHDISDPDRRKVDIETFHKLQI